jgi:peptidyl-dipeptidase A
MKALVFNIAMLTSVTCLMAQSATIESRARTILDLHAKEIQPLEKAVNLAWWNANVSGKDDDFKKKEEAQNKYDERLSDPELFAELKAVKSGLPQSADPILRRQIDLLYLQVLEKQVPSDLLKKITAKGNAVEQAFNVYRAVVDGRELTDSQVKKILKTSKDSKERRAAWEASKGVGPLVEKDLKEVVALRNEAAVKLGFPNFHALQLYLNEQEPDKILALFDELDSLTRAPFLKAKAEIDERLAASYKIPVNELRPWHYHDPFFQEAPSVFEADLDSEYAKVDILKLCRDFYAGIGLPIDDVIARSDLYEKKGKSPHAFCQDIDRQGDVRVLGNIVPNENWMSTMLHELGHSVYSSKNIPASLPYPLRMESHILTTEGVAMLFQKFSKSADWLQAMGVTLKDPTAFNETGRKLTRVELLVFSRWAQVMFRFEKALYENPQQDLNKLWWDLVEKYQGLTRPEGRNEPDYASKIHLVVAPAYYHNYLMGQLFASQVHHTVSKDVLKQKPGDAIYVGNKKVGDYFKAKIFVPGKTLSWNELTRFATGQPLNAKSFAEDLSD